ncbi:MAG: hypothetical protein WCF59_09520 [Desulfobaccales bacterium]
MKKKGVKERLKPLSLYGIDPKDAIRACMRVDPDELKELEKKEKQVSGTWIAKKKTDKN